MIPLLSELVKSFAGNRDIPLRLFLISPGSESAKYTSPTFYLDHRCLLSVVYRCLQLHDESKTVVKKTRYEVYMIGINSRGCDITSVLLTIPPRLAVCVQVLSREEWNKVLLDLQTCGPGQGRIKTTSLSNVSPRQNNDHKTHLASSS